MTSVDTAQDVAVLRALDFDAELPCESEHTDYRNAECTKVGTEVAGFCKLPVRIVCANHAKFVRWALVQGGACGECGRPITDCWSIRPI